MRWGRWWYCIIHLQCRKALIKPRLLFSHAGYAFCGLYLFLRLIIIYQSIKKEKKPIVIRLLADLTLIYVKTLTPVVCARRRRVAGVPER